MGSTVTFSRSLTLSITTACLNHCHYCGYWTCDLSVLSLEDAERLLREGKRRGCREALVLSGERPWELKSFPLGEEEFVQRVYDICLLALQLGLLPHSNVGTLSYRALARLRAVNPSMGLMLETSNDNLQAHRGPGKGGKRVQDRLRHIVDAGRLRIPFTTGILVGIGESAQDRRDALRAIDELHRRHGHIQEVIIQPFKPKKGTAMGGWPEPSTEEMADIMAYARRLMPHMALQVPPNLNRSRYLDLIKKGSNDLGGLSANGDLVNPESPNPNLEEMRKGLERTGYNLLERLPVHPEVEADLGPAADTLRRELVGDRVTYVVNCNVNFTNICDGRCTFCGFYRREGHREAFTFDLAQVLGKIRAAVERGATEVCLQGGLNPALELGYYTEMLRAIKSVFPNLHIHAFSPMEVYSLAKRQSTSVQDVLERLKDSGLDSMPGTAAEILVDEVRQKICAKKLSTAEWVDMVRRAHRLGIRSTATIMFGHIETWEHRIRHLEVIRNLQLETGGFTEFVLLPFLPGRTVLARRHRLQSTSLNDILKLTAYARLYLGRDLPNIQNSWVKLGVKGAQETLRHGANDFGGTLMEESISRSVGSTHGQYLPPERIQEIIREAGRIPVERDTLYQPVHRDLVA